MDQQDLLLKYNIPAPRYTSYPTVPYWNESMNTLSWKEMFYEQFKIHNLKEGLALYIHLPFCESLCTYCGCNKKISLQHHVELPYVEAVLKEWKMYLNLMNQAPIIREIHLGGGTPTFFSPENLVRLLTTIFNDAIIHPQYEFSFEGHPNNTTREHLEALYQLGFRRVSFGVQDNDPVVQKAINRIQPLENVKSVTGWARDTGYTSVNYDLIYGLPFQNTSGLEKTLHEVLSLRPDRIAFYNYAHIPWKSKSQRLYSEQDLPLAQDKIKLYTLGKEIFMDYGYVDIGMDHFALAHDSLVKAKYLKNLHRNFMGYTQTNTSLLLGLGVSSISDASKAYAQNEKELKTYYESIAAGELPIAKGLLLDKKDEYFRQHILNIACNGTTTLDQEFPVEVNKIVLPRLKELEADGLVEIRGKTVFLTAIGQQLTRIVCHAFDLYASGQQEKIQNQFSKAI
ncbi:oxygen-independent coproporphyrinogen III oxidase [Chitinophaga caeni]|uniref:Coproporphyrinogen-III oxidase n=1 Tax=Chitinophaga caeni TaxID=2029983 RepID=A0A291QRJ2_9BACT|nr:oxygen-independent coproporphyrinogen III oxidase [Chitinophaga caeni]ATL46629.1 oxygen-independent coproporphyrinogen III oxidase [Chitinophaga caeni]